MKNIAFRGKQSKELASYSISPSGSWSVIDTWPQDVNLEGTRSSNNYFLSSPNGKYFYFRVARTISYSYSFYRPSFGSPEHYYSNNAGVTFSQFTPPWSYGVPSNITNDGIIYYDLGLYNGTSMTVYSYSLNTLNSTTLSSIAFGYTGNGASSIIRTSRDGSTIFVGFPAANSYISYAGYAISKNGGSTFTTYNPSVPYSGTSFGQAAQWYCLNAQVSADGNNIFFSLDPGQGGTFAGRYYYSTNGGASFTQNTNVSTYVDVNNPFNYWYSTADYSGRTIMLSSYRTTTRLVSNDYGASFSVDINSYSAPQTGVKHSGWSDKPNHQAFKGGMLIPDPASNAATLKFYPYNTGLSGAMQSPVKVLPTINPYTYPYNISMYNSDGGLNYSVSFYTNPAETNYIYFGTISLSRANTSSGLSGSFKVYRKSLRKN